jgi:hypothetical protein
MKGQAVQPPPLLLGTAAEPRPVTERSVDISHEHNTIVVDAADHSWVSLSQDGDERIRESGGAPQVSFPATPGSYLIRSDGILNAVDTTHRPLPAMIPFQQAADPRLAAGAGPAHTAARLELAADTADRNQADDVAELLADGSSFCTVTVTGPADTEVFLRATGGRIMTADGTARARVVQLTDGRAEFRFVADDAPKLVTLYAFTAEPGLRTELPVEFV